MKCILCGVGMFALLGCVGPPLDVALRSNAAAPPVSAPPAAPVLVYDLVLAVGDAWRRGPEDLPDSLCDRVAKQIGDLLRARGFEPVRREPRAGAPWVRLTLIEGPKRIVLWADAEGESASRRTYSGPAGPVRATVDALLGRMLTDFANQRDRPAK